MSTDKIPLIEKDIQTMSDSIKDLKSDMKAHRDDTALRHREFQDFREELFDRLDKKYAGKWVEKIMLFVGWIVWTAIIGWIMALIIKS